MNKKLKNVFETIVIVLIVLSIGVFLVSIKTVDFYTYTIDKKEVVLGFNRGKGGEFSKWDLTVDDDNNIKVTNAGVVMLSGFTASAEGLKNNKEKFNNANVPIVKTGNKKKLEYTIYNDNGRFFYFASFEKTEEIGLIIWTETSMTEEEAVALLERFQATKGIGYYIFEIVDAMG